MENPTATAPTHGPAGVNTAALTRLRSIEGQIQGIQRMVTEERYCMEIVDQISAARAALARVSTQILQRHLEHCVVHDLRTGTAEDQERVVAELMQVIEKKLR